MKKIVFFLFILSAGVILSCNQSPKTQKEVSSKSASNDALEFHKIMHFQNIEFNIKSIRKEYGMSELTIIPSGLEIDNRAQTQIVEGRVINAEVEDLNSDGSPELLIYTQSDGSGSYGNVIAWSVNNRKSMSMIYFPAITDDAALCKGYMGHDEFRVVETSLVRRFPIYREGDSNANPTGGIRQITYKLVDGEAMRKFEVKEIGESDL
jgi:Periplasmic lysozyme inhibitor of I-type lysozyme